MSSVTGRIGEVTQPTDGYIQPKAFTVTQLDGGGIDDLAKENVSPALIGLAVDYMTRFMSGTDAGTAFAISRKGAQAVYKLIAYETLINQIKGLDDKSIQAAIKLSGFDTAYRAGPMTYKPIIYIEPDAKTIANIRTMVVRSLRFFEQYGPKTKDMLTFDGGYTATVSAGDGDFMTEDTVWEFKVSKRDMQKDWGLQLLMYWRMGLHSVFADDYNKVKYLGVYNPRQNKIYRVETAGIDTKVIESIERDVIGYDGEETRVKDILFAQAGSLIAQYEKKRNIAFADTVKAQLCKIYSSYNQLTPSCTLLFEDVITAYCHVLEEHSIPIEK